VRAVYVSAYYESIENTFYYKQCEVLPFVTIERVREGDRENARSGKSKNEQRDGMRKRTHTDDDSIENLEEGPHDFARNRSIQE
jgi:hypothetical protein